MIIPTDIRARIERAEHYALATRSEHAVSVIPVSALHIEDDALVLCDWFMEKTARNLGAHPQAALAVWAGFNGVRIEGITTREESGKRFERIRAWSFKNHPNRTLRGIFVLTPECIYDIAPANAGARLA